MKTTNRVIGAILGLSVLWVGPSGFAQAPVGSQFQINSYTTSYQVAAAVGTDSEGAFIVVWESFGSDNGDTEGLSVQGQRYSSDGGAVGSEFRVNSFTSSYQAYPEIAVEADGDFVVVWDSDGSATSDSSFYSIQGQRYSSEGSPLGPEFQVNSFTTNDQAGAAVAVDASGNFVVAWQSEGSSGDDTLSDSVQGQRYASGGNALGPELQVNSYTTMSQRFPSIAMEANGDLVVVWQSDGSSGDDTLSTSIQGQRYSSGGSAIGSEFQVNSYTTNAQRNPSVAMDQDGDFVVIWESDGSNTDDISSFSIRGQRYTSGGSAIGSEFQVNSYTTGYQRFAAVAMGANGDFVVAWHSDGSDNGDSDGISVQGQRYSSDGSASDGQFLVNAYTTSVQAFPAVAAGPAGDFVIAWNSLGSYGSDSAGFSVQGQRFRISTLFDDGFESGDTTAWSATVP